MGDHGGIIAAGVAVFTLIAIVAIVYQVGTTKNAPQVVSSLTGAGTNVVATLFK
jgi:hypothetical protein